MEIGYPQGVINTHWIDTFSLFFDSNQIKMKKSPESSHSLFLKGKKRILDEFCLPVKIFAGHVIQLVEETDLPIFIPCINGNKERNSFLCPIEIRVTDILINSGILPKERLISPQFVFDDHLRLSFVDGDYPGKSLNLPFNSFIDKSHVSSFWSGEISEEKSNILLLGRSYVISDLWLNGGIKKSLTKLDVNVLTLNHGGVTSLNTKIVDNQNLKKKTLADYSHFALSGELFRGVENIIDSVDIDGIIVLKPFLCGPDCGMESDILRFIPKDKQPPILALGLDEHLSQEGIQTRLEAFTDLIHIQKNRKNMERS